MLRKIGEAVGLATPAPVAVTAATEVKNPESKSLAVD